MNIFINSICTKAPTAICTNLKRSKGMSGKQVTRFGEILPLWQIFSSLGQLFKALFSVLQNFEPSSAIFYALWAFFCCWKWPQIEK